MSESIQEYLARTRPDRETILQATRYYVSERAGELAPDTMFERVETLAADRMNLGKLVEMLASDADDLETLCVAVLAAGWEQHADQIRLIINEAKRKLPVIETAVLAIVAIYGLHLVYTGGIKSTLRRIKRSRDGSVTIEESVEYLESPGPLSALVQLFSVGSTGQARVTKEDAKRGKRSSGPKRLPKHK